MQSLKASGQQIQLQQIQQSGSLQPSSLPQQILLRPSLAQGTLNLYFTPESTIESKIREPLAYSDLDPKVAIWTKKYNPNCLIPIP